MILPVVPLNTVSIAHFYIINDGYEKLKLKHNFVQSFGNLDLDINYIENDVLSKILYLKALIIQN